MMHQRLVYTVAFLLPCIAALVVARVALPPAGARPMVAPPPANTTANKQSAMPTEVVMENSAVEAPTPPSRQVPETLVDAKRLTQERITHLQTLTQERWEQERKTIMDRNPPQELSQAILRTRERLRDLEAMDDGAWQDEKRRLSQRFQRR